MKLESAMERQPNLARYLCHLFQRSRLDKVNLVTGAGISIEAGVPGWVKLLEKLAEMGPSDLGRDVKTHQSAGLNPEYVGQIIYHRFRDDVKKEHQTHHLDARINHRWAQSIHDAIYSEASCTSDVIVNHPYLKSLARYAARLPLVINFNFDDFLSEAINLIRIESNEKERSFSLTWSAPLTERISHTTIYHVNGVLPRVSLKKRSPMLVFTEDSFSAALARSTGVKEDYVFLRFVQNTMLIIGHSLADSSLKNYLRKNRYQNPANHHYLIYWIPKCNAIGKPIREDIFRANLELYNLITIFLTSSEISEVFLLLDSDEREFREIIDEMSNDGRSRYHYYIAGPVAAGKSSVLENLRCFDTHEEWTRPPPPIMYKSFDKLSESEQGDVDKFIYSELKEKNSRMAGAGVGFHFMDRAPLDLYAFSKSQEEVDRKAEDIKTQVTMDRPLQQGEIIMLVADEKTLVERNLGRGRPPEDSGKAEYFTRQTNALRLVYAERVELRTDNNTSDCLAREIVHHALFGEYKPCNLQAGVDSAPDIE